MSENKELFNRFMKMKNEIQSIAAVVQNPMTLSEQDLENWEQEMIEPFYKKFAHLIADVKEFYNK